MHLVGTIGFILFGCAAVICGVAHEWLWQRRSKGTIIKGVVVGNVADFGGESGPTYAPEIEYTTRGESRRFVSAYERGEPLPEGETVDVLLSPHSQGAEHYTAGTRWMFTIVPLLFGLVFILVGVNIKPARAQVTTKPEDQFISQER
jgi:hypothetical protein